MDKIGKKDADMSFKKSLLPAVTQDPQLFGRHAQAFAGSDAENALLGLAHRMATVIMAYGFDLESGSTSSSEYGEDDGADGSSQNAYELNKGMVPLADLFNADGDLNNIEDVGQAAGEFNKLSGKRKEDRVLLPFRE